MKDSEMFIPIYATVGFPDDENRIECMTIVPFSVLKNCPEDAFIELAWEYADERLRRTK